MTMDQVVPNENWEPGGEFYINPEVNEKFMDCLDDHNPWYTEDSPFGWPIANQGVLHIKACEAMMRRFTIEPGPGGSSLHSRQESELHHPAKVGEKVKIEVRLINKYVKRDSDYVVTEARCLNEQGVLLLTSRHFRYFGRREQK